MSRNVCSPLRVPQKQARKNAGSGSNTPPPPYAASVRPPPPVLLQLDSRHDPEKMMSELGLDSPSDKGAHDEGRDEAHWTPRGRTRRGRFVGVVAVLVVVVLGLAVGLSLGLAKGEMVSREERGRADALPVPTASLMFDGPGET